jgi:hypothetical protein
MTKTSHDFFNETARFETIIHVASAVADDCAFPRSFEDFCEMDLPENDDADILNDLPPLKALLDGQDYNPDADEIGYALQSVGGYLVQFATPVRQYDSETGCGYSWRYYSTEWRWFKTMEEAEDGLLVWVESKKAKALEKFRASQQKPQDVA